MKKLLIIALMLLAFAFSVQAGFDINLDPAGVLANGTIKNTQNIYYGVLLNNSNVSSSFVCQLWTTENGTYAVGDLVRVQTESAVSNNTAFNFSLRNGVAETSGADYTWRVNCSSSEGEHNWSSFNRVMESGNYTFGVDVTSPEVTVNNITSFGAWFNTNNSQFLNLSVVDENAGTCILDTNMNVSTPTGTLSNNGTLGDFVRDFSTFSYTNATAFNFSRLNNTGAINWSERATETPYMWNYRCNDTAGNIATGSSNVSVYVDVTAPSAFTFWLAQFSTDHRVLENGSRASDYQPQIGWDTTTEANFSRYEIFFYNTSLERSVLGFIVQNETSRTTNKTNLTSNLAGDVKYFINITAFDLSGNKRQLTTTGYDYTTWSNNRELKSGWNIFGNVGNNFTLSEILNWSGGTITSYWNDTHEFESHVSAGSYGGRVILPGKAVLVYLSNDSTFNDMIYNTTAIIDHNNATGENRVDYTSLTVNLTNQTASDWNLVINLNSSTNFRFNQIDNYTNTCRTYADCDNLNISFMSFYNVSAAAGSKYVPYVNNWTINNATSIRFGSAFWAFVRNDGSNNVVIDWGNLSGY